MCTSKCDRSSPGILGGFTYFSIILPTNTSSLAIALATIRNSLNARRNFCRESYILRDALAPVNAPLYSRVIDRGDCQL